MKEPPSLAEIITAMQVLKPAEPKGVEKHVPFIVCALIIGLGGWLMTGLNAMQTSVTQVATTVGAIQRQVDDMVRRNDNGNQTQAAMQTSVARLEQRVSQNEQRIGALEGRGADGQARSSQNPL